MTVPAALRLPPGLARPGERRVTVRLTRDAQRQVRGGHPWVYDSSINSISHDGVCGDLAVLFDNDRRFLAIGLYDPDSPIRVRVIHQGRPRPVDEDFWLERVGEAFGRRRALSERDETNAYRCIHGENDQLPGLVLDRYDTTWVVKLDTPAWLPHLGVVLEAARTAAGESGPDRIVLRTSRTARQAAERAGLADGMVVAGSDPDGPVGFRENGLAFEADVVRGQKTGHFLDQRDNRARLRALVAEAGSGVGAGTRTGSRSADRPGAPRVLDVFSCTGGFSVHAAAGGAGIVHSVDASRHAIDAVERNLALNLGDPLVARCRSRSTVGDAFAVMADLARTGERFAVVVVDPPSFASKQADVQAGLSAYRRLTGLALDLLVPGGRLLQSSCSSRIPADSFFDTVIDTARSRRRPLREIERTGHAVDHPIGFAQGAYLKTIVARAD